MNSLHKWVWAWTNSEVGCTLSIFLTNRVLQAICLQAKSGRTNIQVRCFVLKTEILITMSVFQFKLILVYFFCLRPIKKTCGTNTTGSRINLSFTLYSANRSTEVFSSATALQHRHGPEKIGQSEKREAGTNHCLDPIYLTMLRLPGSWRFSNPCVLHG